MLLVATWNVGGTYKVGALRSKSRKDFKKGESF